METCRQCGKESDLDKAPLVCHARLYAHKQPDCPSCAFDNLGIDTPDLPDLSHNEEEP